MDSLYIIITFSFYYVFFWCSIIIICIQTWKSYRSISREWVQYTQTLIFGKNLLVIFVLACWILYIRTSFYHVQWFSQFLFYFRFFFIFVRIFLMSSTLELFLGKWFCLVYLFFFFLYPFYYYLYVCVKRMRFKFVSISNLSVFFLYAISLYKMMMMMIKSEKHKKWKKNSCVEFLLGFFEWYFQAHTSR